VEDDVIDFQQIERQPNPTGKDWCARLVGSQLLGVVGHGKQGKEGYIFSRVCVERINDRHKIKDNGDRICISNLIIKRT